MKGMKGLPGNFLREGDIGEFGQTPLTTLHPSRPAVAGYDGEVEIGLDIRQVRCIMML